MIAFGIGQFDDIQSASAVSGRLNSEYGNWASNGINDEDNTIIVEKEGNYLIRVTGETGGQNTGNAGQLGGDISCIAYMHSGDVIRAKFLNGGGGGVNSSVFKAGDGGRATIVYLNDIPLVGAAGGMGGPYGENVPTSSVNTLNNETFAGGSGGRYTTSKRTYNGSAGEALDGYSVGVYMKSATNYLDTSRADLVEMPNKSLSVSYSIQYKKKTAEDEAETLNSIAQELNGIKQTIANGNSNTTAPEIITVIAGKPIDEYIIGNDGTIGGENDGIQIINNDTTDSYVRVVGLIESVGYKEVVIDGIKYRLKVIEEPNSTNVSASI